MAGPISILALRDLHADDRGPSRTRQADEEEDLDDDGYENVGDDELEEMERDDERYRRILAAEVENLSRRQSRSSLNQVNGYGLQRTDSPGAMSRSSRDRNDDTELSISPSRDGEKGRAVAVDVSVRDSLEKQDTTYGVPKLGKHVRRGSWTDKLAPSRIKTSRTFRTFSTMMSESWESRHDPKFRGFWINVWEWLVGKKEVSEQPNEGDPDYMPPKYRWTPILSGLLQPFSILLEIPGLTEHWYVKQIDNVPVAYQENPVILDVGLAISMTCAVIANVALISRFMERRVFASTVTTIVGLTIHDCINIAAVTAFGVIHSVNDGFDYSEAFWLCLCSTVASAFTNVTLIYDLVKTKDFRRSGSGLTPKQRKLVIIVMILLVYIALGALLFNFLIPEISFQNALYYTVVTIETIGFGDVLPSTLGAKIFLFFYAPIGILNLAVAVGTARDTLVESWSTAYRRRRHEVIRRHRERKQQRYEESVRKLAIEKQLQSIGAPVYVDTNGGGIRGGAKGKRLNVRALTKVQLQAAEDEALSAIAAKQGSGSAGEQQQFQDRYNKELGHAATIDDVRRLQDELTKQSMMSEEGYREFQERMAKEEKMENWINFAFSFGLFFVFWIVGATIFARTEEWTWFEGFYFCFVTFTTIGYGDYYPTSPAGRATFIIWALFGVATVTLLIAVLTEAYSNRYKSALLRKGAKQAMTAIKKNNEIERVQQDHRKYHAIDRGRAERLPHEVIALMQKWHGYVAAMRMGALEGNDEPQILALLHDLLDDQNLSDVEKKELLGDTESRKMLFWNGYERAVYRLISVAEHAIHYQDKLHRHLTVLTELSSPLTPGATSGIYTQGSGLSRTRAHSNLGQKAPWLPDDWGLDPEMLRSPDQSSSRGRLDTVKEVGSMDDLGNAGDPAVGSPSRRLRRAMSR